MDNFITPVSKLDAVNICLSSIGEPKVVSLEDSGVDALMAADIIDETSRSVQLRGWHWNREIHTISPDNSGFLNLPANTGKVDSVGTSYDVDVVQRGMRLFNRATNSYVFTKAIQVELFAILAWDDLSATIKDYIAAAAAMVLQQRILGSTELDGYLKAKATSAWHELIRDDLANSDNNMLTDSYTTQSMLSRGTMGWGRY
jgi:hypothetical protein